ncbi:TetR/AcrR family transcriptional regulator [Candidatus Halobonum tyrrellensis]|uniref:Transcriptional regulator n=1 Tax=Candidatus Halobonum tyrrellensis G22 TaxID=1324957 RepID=V4HGY6_9EURY|nr:TetR/AcrR family transcriptional regulator [Candidatus Halobonum tyrrellensis]ESP87099.1 transcriptional regulator [Candidatus Halobonum tyrrellensis G22]
MDADGNGTDPDDSEARAHSALDDPRGTREEIMQATYRALCDHGYADLTIQRIGDRFAKSKSLLYHHYDGKDELLLDFLSFMLEEFERTIDADPGDDPAAHFESMLDHVLAPDLPDDRREFGAAMVELRAQAAHDARYRAEFTRHDRFFRDRIARAVRAGVERGAFRSVDPDRVAAFVFTVIGGVRTHRPTSDIDDVAVVRAELGRYLDAVLSPDGGGISP